MRARTGILRIMPKQLTPLCGVGGGYTLQGNLHRCPIYNFDLADSVSERVAERSLAVAHIGNSWPFFHPSSSTISGIRPASCLFSDPSVVGKPTTMLHPKLDTPLCLAHLSSRIGNRRGSRQLRAPRLPSRPSVSRILQRHFLRRRTAVCCGTA